MLERALDVRAIQKLLGHRRVKTTTLYLHMTHNVMQSIRRRAEAIVTAPQ